MTKQPVPGLHENFAEEAAMSTDKAMVTDAMVDAGLRVHLSIVNLPAGECLHESDVREILSAALAKAGQPVAVKPSGYLFEMRYGDDRWSGTMFAEEINLPLDDVRNVRPLYAHPPAKREAGETAAPESHPMPLTWLVAERGGLEAVTDLATYRAASLASDYAILEINGKRTDEDFPSVEAACRAAFADYARRLAPVSTERVSDTPSAALEASR